MLLFPSRRPIRLGKEEVMKMPMVYFEGFHEEEINEVLCLVNHRPRKCLGWITSFELFHEQV